MNIKRDTHALLRRLYIRSMRRLRDDTPHIVVWFVIQGSMEREHAQRIEFGAN